MKVIVFYGSVRTERQGIKAARYIVNKLEERKHDVELVDAEELDLPLLDKMYKELKKGEDKTLDELSEKISDADGFVVVSGEYNHSIPPALSNMLDHFMEEYFFRPSAIVSYSAGDFGGVRAAMQLRAFLSEVGMPSISSTFPISKVQDFKEDGTPSEKKYDRYITRFLDEFEWYMQALKEQRKKGTPF